VGFSATGSLGDEAENKALRFLIREGLTPVTRNFRTRGGEIDLIMLHGVCLTFIEVRYRQSSRFSRPALTVDHHKQNKILRTAALFLAREKRYAGHIMRFDVIAIEGGEEGRIEWIQDAFRPNNSAL
jgi:putative endonuclease